MAASFGAGGGQDALQRFMIEFSGRPESPIQGALLWCSIEPMHTVDLISLMEYIDCWTGRIRVPAKLRNSLMLKKNKKKQPLGPAKGDFIVPPEAGDHQDGRKAIIEVKDPSRLDSNDVQRKRQAAEMWCKQRNMEYILAAIG